MKDLSIEARIYLFIVYIAGISILVWHLIDFQLEDTILFIALCVLASLSLILKVVGSTARSHYNISFLIYAFSFVMLGTGPTLVVILVSNLADWIWHKYVWYIQTFNIASYFITLAITALIFRLVFTQGELYQPLGVIALLLAMAGYTMVNHLLVGIVIWLARGENFAKSGIFKFFPLMLDFTLLCMGAVAAILWLASPFAVILVLLPLYLIYSTLKVPALERQSETDAKTGLYNARYFERALQTELKRANRFDRPLTIVMADLDLLRNINNTYGHLAGDEVLIGVANILKKSVRDYDVVSRFGGEEYAILMPETTPAEAFPRIEAIRESIETAEFAVPTSVTPIKITMSFGIAGRQGYDQAGSDIVHNADAALYHAKLRGRNGTFIYSDEGFINLFGQKEEAKGIPEHFSLEDRVQHQDIPLPPSSLRTPPSVVHVDPVEEPAPREHNKRVLPAWVVNLYISTLFVTAFLLFFIIFRPGERVDWFGLAIFVGIAVLTEWFSVDIYVRNTAVSTSAAPITAGILLFGPIGAVVLSFGFSLVAMLKHGSRFSRFIFNASNQMIAGMLYLGLISLGGNTFTNLPSWEQFIISLGAIAIVYVTTTFLISLGISLDTNISVQELWTEQYSWLSPYYFAMGLIGYGLIFSYQTAGLMGLAVVIVPLMVLRFSQKQYIDRTRAYVNELKEKNQALYQSAQEIQKLSDGLLDTLAEVVDMRDSYALTHSRQVANYAEMIGKALGLPPRQVELVRKAGLLHDIGKLGVKESILFKPATLTLAEYDLVKGHPARGADLLQKTHSLKNLIPIIRHHHEHFDGKGYPDSLTGNDIPLEARIIGVADAVDAMATDRPYRHSRSQNEIIEELMRNSGTQFDPFIVKIFVDIVRARTEQTIVNLNKHADEADKVLENEELSHSHQS